MSNHFAISTVTAVLRRTLQQALDAASPIIPGARATTTRPNAPTADLPNPGVNIFLYQTTPSEGLRNMDLPLRRGDMTPAQRPQAALDLHYLLTFHGNDALLEPQTIHGITTRALHEQPVLTRAVIAATVADPDYAFVQASDSAEAPELTRLSPVALSVEEMAKLWSIFYQIPYVLSVAYRASVVVIESEVAPQRALPVRQARVQVQASSGPQLDQVVAAPAGPGQNAAWIFAGDEVVLLGEHLQAEVTRVRFGDVEVVPEPAAVTDRQIRVRVPASLAAGIQGVQVVHRATADAASVTAASNVAPLVLHPKIAVGVAERVLSLSVTPPVGSRQRAVVLLNEVDAPAGRDRRAYELAVPARPASTPDPAATLELAVPDVAPGSYLVRVRVDTIESPLGFDAAGGYISPRVTIA